MVFAFAVLFIFLLFLKKFTGLDVEELCQVSVFNLADESQRVDIITEVDRSPDANLALPVLSLLLHIRNRREEIFVFILRMIGLALQILGCIFNYFIFVVIIIFIVIVMVAINVDFRNQLNLIFLSLIF